MRTCAPPSRQRGVVLLFALIALLILMIGAAALVRSFNTSLFLAGNVGFKRDLQSRNDYVTTVATNALADTTSTGLGTRQRRSANHPESYYSATLLSVDKQGIPDVLTRADRTDQTGTGSAFVLPSGELPIGDGSVTFAYVIDRLCASTGDEKVLGPSQCTTVTTVSQGAGLQQERNSDTTTSLASGTLSSAPTYVLYRLSARIKGPRNTVSYFQSTIKVPS